ncbi:MAG: hypothetical protein L6Q75_01930 [Burkholderiaceae bacterium]|nr:hypothetical protein [Burkholderiaceae bacterium]
MIALLRSVQDKTAPEMLSRASVAYLAASDGVFSPEPEQVAEMARMIDRLVERGTLKTTIKTYESKSWNHYRVFDAGRGEWVEVQRIMGSTPTERDVPQGAEMVPHYRHEEFLRAEDVGSALLTLGERGEALCSVDLLAWLALHGVRLPKRGRQVEVARPDDQSIKLSALGRVLEGEYGKWVFAAVKPKLDHAADYPWLAGCKAGHGKFWRSATIQALEQQGLLPRRVKSSTPAQPLRAVG